MKSPKLTRRQLIQRGAAGAAGLSLLSMARTSLGADGANDRIRIAIAGLHGRGGDHLGNFCKLPGVEVAYVVDPDRRLFDGAIKHVEKATGKAPKAIQDIREALDDKELNAISIATPNHWHSLMTIWACQAGKDVYVEKPLSHNIHEGRIAFEAARKYNRIVQHGTQRRSDPKWARVIAAIHSGKLGKLHVARGLCYKRRDSIGVKPIQAAPAEVDFNLWLGPAPFEPYHENLVHYNWHWFWPQGNGDIGNQGVHQMDVAFWGIKDARFPRKVVSIGGRLGYTDQADTPNTLATIMDYGDTQLIFETRGLKTDKYMGAGVGNIFHLEAGTIVEHTFYPTGSSEPAPLPEVEAPIGPGPGPYGNFIAAVRSRKHTDLNADVEVGHYSSALCHLSNASYQLGSDQPYSDSPEALAGNDAGLDTMARMGEHLRNNGLDTANLTVRVGRVLEVNPETGMTGDGLSDSLLRGVYRAPFVVPDRLS